MSALLMRDGSHSPASSWQALLRRHWAWLAVGLAVLFVLGVRVRLRDMPLERDEGEYAYAGQLILQGVPPYQEAYNMKLPGTYAAYAAIMAVFGQTPSGIRLGVALLNAASIIMVFLLGRRLLDEITGVTAAVAFALLSLSPSVLGLAAHATHFVIVAALGGILLLLRSLDLRLRPTTARQAQDTTARQAEDSDTQHATPSLRPTTARQAQDSDTLRAPRSTLHAPTLTLLASALLFGLAFVMKQHGLFFGIFGFLYLLRVRTGQWLEAASVRSQQPGVRSLRERRRLALTSPASRAGLAQLLLNLGCFALGWLLPYGLTFLVLWLAGALHQFVFWTITYAAKYASAVSLVNGPEVLRSALRVVVGPNLIFWLLPWLGALVMWWEERFEVRNAERGMRSAKSVISHQSSVIGNHALRPTLYAPPVPHPRFFLTLLLFCSIASVCVGLYFREHYFITLLPVLGLLSGVAVSRAVHLLKYDRTIELFLAVPILGMFAIAVCSALIGNGAVWLGLARELATRSTFGSTLFTETERAAEYIKSNTAPGARIAVLGSEPEIYFLSGRRSATGYIYMYPLMEEQPYAQMMQNEMIRQIEQARPEFMVYIDDEYSWLPRNGSERKIVDWWKEYWAANLVLVKTLEVEERAERGTDIDQPAKEGPTLKHILIFKRRQ